MYFSHLVKPTRLALPALALSMLFASTASAQHYVQTNLTSDTGIGGTKTDGNLVNAWGMSRSSGSPWWISDNGTGKSTLYGADGTIVPLVVNVPGAPTGTVYNSSQDFMLHGSPAVFLFASEDGTISAWNGGPQAFVVYTNSTAVYKGLAIANFQGANYLYATDFHNGRVDVLDSSFHKVYGRFNGDGNRLDFNPYFVEGQAHGGLSPFGIQNIGGSLIVTFAKPNSAGHDDVHAPGNGFVASYTPGGKLIRTYKPGKYLNSPWAVALAPGDFGRFSHDLLIGEFGSGEIVAYNALSGEFDGVLLNTSGMPLAIDGLWGLGFGNGGRAGALNALYFTAGPNGESNGLFGSLTVDPTDPTLGNSN